MPRYEDEPTIQDALYQRQQRELYGDATESDEDESEGEAELEEEEASD